LRLIAESQCGKDTADDTLYLDCIPKANFGYKVIGRKVQFTDSSSTYLSRVWSFGDGAKDTSRNPLHTYTNNGLYDVKLLVKGVCRNDSISFKILINCNPPVSGFTSLDTNRTIHFVNTTSGAEKRIWYFGDGAKDTSKNPVHNYSLTGKYTVKLVSENYCGKDSVSKLITVQCPLPQIDYNYLLNEDTIQCTAYTNSLAVKNWKFDFGDGTVVFAKNARHEYSSKGKFTITLTAGNQCGNDTVRKSIDLLCKINAGFTYQWNGNKLQVTNTSKHALKHFWNFGDGVQDTAMNPSHTYSDTGYFNVKQIVLNACGSDSITLKVRNTCYRPQSDFNFSTSEFEARFNNTSKYSGSQVWKFGDGNTDTTFNPVHMYQSNGTYTVVLVSENTCGKDSVSKQLTITCTPLQVNFNSVVTDRKIYVTAFDSISTAFAYAWNFGDGNTDTGKVTNHTYANDGDYHIVLISYNACMNDTVVKLYNIRTQSISDSYCKEKLAVIYSDNEIKVFTAACDFSIRSISLYTLNGKKLNCSIETQGSNLICIKAEYLTTGIYLLELMDEKGRAVRTMLRVLR
jgi:PKD repeat protein